MSIHIEAKTGEIADFVLLPGDPLRARHIAENLLEDAVCYNNIRGMLGYTGFYRGRKVSVQGTGMGLPSLTIYVTELINDYGVKSLIRVGTCGGIMESIKVRDLLIAISASTDSSIVARQFEGMTFAPTASFNLLKKAVEMAGLKGIPYKAGNILSSDLFYHDPLKSDAYEIWRRYGTLAVEMESAGLYMLASRYGVDALSLLTVSDHILTGEHVPPLERQENFTKMSELALSLAI
ncbi:MAG TPA: purine-nucleoside phosphorylase [Bacteroidales bacterium]|nr:purine-nucleoside phosphorylase [Bacteroidales bacterium]